MFKVEDILARLQNGEATDDIANEFVSALNNAAKAYNEEAAAKKAEAEAKAKKETQKMQDMQDILDLLHDFCIEYYCDGDEDINAVEAAFADLTAENVITMIEEAGAAALEIEALLKSFNDIQPKVVKVKKTDADGIIKSFLNAMGL